MTDGHKHRLLHIGHDFNWWPVRLLRKPVWKIHDPDLRPKVDASPYPYAVIREFHGGKARECYTLSLLGILHRWTGLTLCTWTRPCPVHDPLPHTCGDPTCTEDHG
jgi:hypothetical protein